MALSAAASWNVEMVGCQNCTNAVTEALDEWAIMEPKFAEDLPSVLCKGVAAGGICTAAVEQALAVLGRVLNETSPVEVCRRLGFCRNASGARTPEEASECLVI